MPFNHAYGQASQRVRIPFRVIDSVYGRDNHDNAGDDMVYCLREASSYVDQYRYSFEDDASHDNPWYHALVLNIVGISESHYQSMLKLLEGFGLIEES